MKLPKNIIRIILMKTSKHLKTNLVTYSNKLGGKILNYITQFKTKCDSPVVAGQTLCLFSPSGRERFTLRRECVVVVVVALRESVAGGLKSARSCRGPASLAPPLPGTFTRHFLSSLTRARCVPTSQKKKPTQGFRGDSRYFL